MNPGRQKQPSWPKLKHLNLNKGLVSVWASQLSNEEKEVVSVDLVVGLEQEVPDEQVGPVRRVVVLLLGKDILITFSINNILTNYP